MWTRIPAALVAFLWFASAQAQDASEAEQWVATWGTAQPLAVELRPSWVAPPPRAADEPPPPSPIAPFPQSFTDETVRMVVRASVGGRRVRLTLSNALGLGAVRLGAVHVALRERDSAIVAGSDRRVTFGGAQAVTLHPGALVVSDAVELAVPALAELAISVYVPTETSDVTTHELGLNTSYVVTGNAVSAAALPQATTNSSYFWLAGVEVLAASGAGTIVAFGDSITDGFSTTPNAQRAWPALLAARLQSDRATARWAVVNAGISGNRVRRDVVGTSALARFDRDVLGRAGVQWMLLFEGINDITFSALPGVPASQSTTAAELIEALSQLIERAHARGIRTRRSSRADIYVAGTLAPGAMIGAAAFSLSRAKPAADRYRLMNSSRSLAGMTSSMASKTPPQRSSSRFNSPNGPAPRLRSMTPEISAHSFRS
jgi:lysophospholipase L1-like esterase